MSSLNGLSVVVLAIVCLSCSLGLGAMIGALVDENEGNLKYASLLFIWSLVAAGVFFAGSFFPAW